MGELEFTHSSTDAQCSAGRSAPSSLPSLTASSSHTPVLGTHNSPHRRVKRTRSALCQPLPSLLRCRSHSLPTLSPSPLA